MTSSFVYRKNFHNIGILYKLCVFCMSHDSKCVLLSVFCVGHDSEGAHYVYFVSAMTLKVYIMCILYGPWDWRCTLCVFCIGHDSQGVHYVYFVWVMALKVYIMCICMGHDSKGVHYVYFVWAVALKVYIMCILYGPWLWRCLFCWIHCWWVWKIPYYLIKQLLTFNFSLLMTIQTWSMIY
jgi:hypothetical protein